MRRWHNLGTVFTFELRRTLRRPSFWVLTLGIPVLMLAITTLLFFSNGEALRGSDASRAPITFTYTDASGLVDAGVARAAGGTVARNGDAAKADVIAGRSEAHFAFPADPTKHPIEVVGRDYGLTQSPPYGAIAQGVLVDSAKTRAPGTVASVLTDPPGVHTVNYNNGRVAPGWSSALLPGSFLVVFYLAILMLGNQMLSITVEEKENRVTEMILTTIHPTTLIVGKLLALVAAGLVQTLVLVVPTLTVPAFMASAAGASLAPDLGAAMPSGLSWPSASDLAAAVNPGAVAVGAALFLGSFLMFTGLLVSVGAIMPTAREAASSFGGIVLGLFLPFYAIGVLMTDPHGTASTVLTFFPLTAPVTAMVRNATGTLTPAETAGVLALIYATAFGMLALGIRLFRTGSLSYNARLDVRKVLSGRRRSA